MARHNIKTKRQKHTRKFYLKCLYLSYYPQYKRFYRENRKIQMTNNIKRHSDL